MKTRFLVMQDQEEKQLFSVEERKNGELGLYLPVPLTAHHEGRKLAKPKNRKISVHLSPNGSPPCHTITHEILFEGSGQHKGYANYTIPEDGRFLWIIINSCFGTNERSYQHRAKNKDDRLRRTTAYISSSNLMLYTILISHPDIQLPKPFGLNTILEPFSKINLTLLYNFADIASAKSSFDEMPYTAHVKETGLFHHSEEILRPSSSLLIETIEPSMLAAYMDICMKVQERNAINSLLYTPYRNPQMRRFPANWPRKVTEKEANYGECPILGHLPNRPGQRLASSELDVFFKGYSEPLKIALET